MIETKNLDELTLTKVHEIASGMGEVESRGYKQGFSTSLTIKSPCGDSITITCQKSKDVKQNLIECIVKANAIRFLCND